MFQSRISALFICALVSCSTPSAAPPIAPSASPSVSPVVAAKRPTPVPLPTFLYTPTPVNVPTPTPTPTSTPTAAPSFAPTISQTHVHTADFWLSQNPALLAPSLTYEFASSGYVAATRAAGIKTITYEDPAMPQGSDHVEVALSTGTYATAMARDCAGNFVTTYNGTGRLLDPHSPSAAQYVQAVIDAHGPTDAIFFDNWNDLYGTNTKPCDFTTYADWAAATNAMLAQVNTHGAELILNTLGIQSVTNQLGGVTPAAVTGAMFESCFVNGSSWTDAETAEIGTIAKGKTFYCYANGAWAAQDATAAIPSRLYVYASFLLTYDPKRTIYGTWLKTASGYKVMPETRLIPLYPYYGIGSIGALQYTGGAYARGYKACYFAGKLVSACEVAVNPSSTLTVPIPNRSVYTRSMVLHGSSILDGGGVTFDGAVPMSLPPKSGAVLFR